MAEDYANESVINALPPFARVAFAARCVERMFGLVGKRLASDVSIYLGDKGLKGTHGVKSTWKSVLDAVKQCALFGHKPEAGLRLALADSIRRALERFSKEDDKRFREGLRTVGECLTMAVDAAISFNAKYVCAIAGVAVELAEERSEEAFEKVDAAQSFDLRLLQSLASEWNEDTHVSLALFGPLWPEGRPPEWDWWESDSKEYELIVAVDVPEGISDQEFLELIAALGGQLDSLHRAYGGHGLKIGASDLIIEDKIEVLAGATA